MLTGVGHWVLSRILRLQYLALSNSTVNADVNWASLTNMYSVSYCANPSILIPITSSHVDDGCRVRQLINKATISTEDYQQAQEIIFSSRTTLGALQSYSRESL